MSFRARLITFFVVIVLLPMIAIGGLFYRLIADSQQGKVDAQANGLATAAASVYGNALATDRVDARRLGANHALLTARGKRLALLMTAAGLRRVVIREGGRTLVDAGDRTAVAPGSAVVSFASGRAPITLTVSTLSAADYVNELSEPGTDAVALSSGGRVLASTIALPAGVRFAPRASTTIDGLQFREVTMALPGFDGRPAQVTVLSRISSGAVSSVRARALEFVGGLLVLALAFALLSSRALQSQVARFLQAARRLASGDFSDPVKTVGNDEFAALAAEFNSMSEQLDQRLQELTTERTRLRNAVRRIGETFASNLDRPALLALALQTAIDATQGGCGRVVLYPEAGGELEEVAREGELDGYDDVVREAEDKALGSEKFGAGQAGDRNVMAAALRPQRHGSRARGTITVARAGRPFSEDEAELLRSLAGQAALAMENIELHEQVSRQAITDELTGLANHGRFQELLEAECEQVRRYHHPLGLIMLDLDDFKQINDSYGHLQGDDVLRRVSSVLQENSRETDWPARYGGEELALILPHTDLAGAFAIAERIRIAIEALEVPRSGGNGPLRVTASLGVAAANDGDKDALVARADRALYEAKRLGKNRTVRAGFSTPNVVGAE